MPYAVKTDQFEGPLDLLLRLIEQEELDVTAIALARVCEDYLAQIRALEERSSEEVADFLLVAAKLLYLKSLVLVPGQGDGEEVTDDTGLAAQLRLYRAFVEASREVASRYGSGAARMFGSERSPIAVPTFLPPPRLVAATIRAVFASIIDELEPVVRIPKARIGRVIAIDARIAEVRRLIATQPLVTFADVLRGRGGSDQHIVSFLAILELVKREEVVAKQAGRFQSIEITRSPVAADGVVRSTTPHAPNITHISRTKAQAPNDSRQEI